MAIFVEGNVRSDKEISVMLFEFFFLSPAVSFFFSRLYIPVWMLRKLGNENENRMRSEIFLITC